MKILLFLFFFFSLFGKSYSQNQHVIDSLKKIITDVEKKCPAPCAMDTTRIIAYIGIGEEIFASFPDSAISIWKGAEKIARKYLDTKPPKNLADSTKKCMAIALNNIGYVYKFIGNIPKALEYYNKALVIQEEISAYAGLSNTLINIGTIYNNKGDIPKALEYFQKSLKTKKKIGDKWGMSIAYNNIGTIYDDQGDIVKALEYYHKGLTLREELDDKKGIGLALNNIGYIYYNQGDIKNALDYYNKSLKIRTEIGDKTGISNSYNNIASLYKNQVLNAKYINNYKSQDSLNNLALEYFYKSLKIRDEIGDKQGYAITLNNIGLIYSYMSDIANSQKNIVRRDSLLKKSVELCEQSLKIREESGYKHDMASSLYSLARFYKQQNQIAKFKSYSERSYKISKELGFPEDISNSASLMKEISLMSGNYKKAYEYYYEQISMRDSLQNEQNYRKTQRQQAHYEYQKQAAIDSIAYAKAMQIKNLELAKTEKENEKQQVVIYSFVFGFAIILIFSIIILRMYFQKKQANKLLAEQNVEINQQKEEIEAQRDEIEIQRDKVQGQKNHIEEIYHEISDSINYAKRIQQAVLPNGIYANKILGDHFILFKPKDVVSGDFYWATKINEILVLTVADCTGHGVPGAFMSMLGISFLNEIVRKKEVSQASHVLDQLRDSIIEALQQKGAKGEQKDGMDLAFVAINTETFEMQFSGANNSAYIITNQRNGNSINTEFELVELKGDKMPVAIHENMNLFTNQIFQLQKGDILYLASDGFEDQFGGPNRKKFLSKNLKNLLLANSQLSMADQNEILKSTLNNWIGQGEQIDDITVLGIKII